MDYIICQQMPRGSLVQYQTSEMENPDTLPYWEFLKFLQTHFFVANFWGLKDAVDSFEKITVLPDGTWEVEPLPDYRDTTLATTLDDLLKINPNIKPGQAEIERIRRENVPTAFIDKLRARLSGFDPLRVINGRRGKTQKDKKSKPRAHTWFP